jgi:hypothetical protein
MVFIIGFFSCIILIKEGVINRFEQETGTGKTMTATYIVNRFFEQTTNNFYDEINDKYYSLGLVYSTCHMFFKPKINPYFREKDYNYTPLGLLPLWKFDDFNQVYGLKIPICVIYDDSDNSRMFLENFIKKSTSWKRKYHMEINFIGHYNKDVNKKVREICNNRYILNIFKDNIEGILYRKYKEIDVVGNEIIYEIPKEFVLKYVVNDLKQLYDTYEVVNPITPFEFEREILKNCKGMKRIDLERVLTLFIGNKKELIDKINDYSKKLGISIE